MDADQKAKHQPGGMAGGGERGAGQTSEMDKLGEGPSDFSSSPSSGSSLSK